MDAHEDTSPPEFPPLISDSDKQLVEDFLRYRVCGMFYTDQQLDLRGAMKKVRLTNKASALSSRRRCCVGLHSESARCLFQVLKRHPFLSVIFLNQDEYVLFTRKDRALNLMVSVFSFVLACQVAMDRRSVWDVLDSGDTTGGDGGMFKVAMYGLEIVALKPVFLLIARTEGFDRDENVSWKWMRGYVMLYLIAAACVSVFVYDLPGQYAEYEDDQRGHDIRVQYHRVYANDVHNEDGSVCADCSNLARLHAEFDALQRNNITGHVTVCCTFGGDVIEHMKKAAFFNYILFEPFETLFVYAVDLAELTCGEHAQAYFGGG